MASRKPSNGSRPTHIGGPTALIEAGVAPADRSDPRPARSELPVRLGYRIAQADRPAIATCDLGPIDALLLVPCERLARTHADARFAGKRPIASRQASGLPRRSVREDGTGDSFPVGAINAVPGVLQQEQPRSRDLLRQRFTVLHREHRVGGAVDDQGWGGD